jgi:hypothetical protein
MKIGNIDLFKIILVIFLFLYYHNSTIGRFQYFDKLSGYLDKTIILDTKTGETFIITYKDDKRYYKSYSVPILK